MAELQLFDDSHTRDLTSTEVLAVYPDRIGDLVLNNEALENILGYDRSLEDRRRAEEISTKEAESPAEAFDQPNTAEQHVQPAPTVRITTPAGSPYRASPTSSNQARTYIPLQGWRSRPSALSSQLSQDTIRSIPDYYSVHDIPPQPDHGKGMSALAAAFLARERDRKVTAERSTIWAYSHNGVELRDFLEELAEQGLEGAVDDSFDITLSCDSLEQERAIKKSGLLSKWNVHYQVIDPLKPEDIHIPQHTAVAILANTLDKLPAYKVYRGPKSHKAIEILEETCIDGNRVVIGIDTRTGQAAGVAPNALLLRETAADPLRLDIAPQLHGKLTIITTKTEIVNTELAADRSQVEDFLDAQPERLRDSGSAFNFAPGVGPLVEAITGGISSDGLVYIGGHLRGTGWLHPNQLSTNQGYVVTNVLEDTSLRQAARTADNAATFATVTGSPGDLGYILIDRGGSNIAQPGSAAAIFQSRLAPACPQDAAAQLSLRLEAARDDLLRETVDAEKIRLTQLIRETYGQLVVTQGAAARDYALALAIAKDINAAQLGGLSEDTLYFARAAHSLAPQLSGSLVEMARAEMNRQGLREALDLLDQARELSPTNPAIYKLQLELLDGNPDLKNHHLSEYAVAAGNYIRNAPNLTSDEIINQLEAISNALLQDAQNYATDNSTFKTIIIQDLETGELRTHTLSVRDVKVMIAADAALANAEAVGMLRDYEGAEVGKILSAQERLFAIWQQVVPREDGLPLPRDEWPDQPRGLTEKWHYNGQLFVCDEVAGIVNSHTITPYTHSTPSYATTAENTHDEYPLEARSSLTIGRTVNTSLEPSSEFELFKHQFPGHVFIVGRTRMGKTTLYQTMFEQLPPMGVNFWAFDLSDKSELSELADNLKAIDTSGDKSRAVELAESLRANGTEVIIIAPGDPDRIPISIDLFTPIEGVTVEEHIGRFVDAWITAYGGGGNSPIAQILTSALRDIYADNNWPVKPADGEAPRERRDGEWSVPSFEELKDACIRRASIYGKGTEAGNIGSYFETRINALQSGAFGDFLTGENAAEWERLSRANVIFDFSNITSHDQRRFLLTALMMQATAHRIQAGLQKEMNTVWAFDEASLITQAAGEGQEARKQAVDAFTGRLRILGGYGVSIWNATQSMAGIDPTFVSQSSIKIALPLGHFNDINGALLAMGVRQGTEDYDRLYGRLLSGKPGEALVWTTGMEKPREVVINKALQPTEQQLARARTWDIPPYVRGNPFSMFTAAQRERALLDSLSPRQAWKRLFIGAITLAHVAHLGLPQVPEALRDQWQAELATDQDAARLVLHEIVNQAIMERTPAIRTSYAPHRLATSVMANALSSLNDEPGSQHVSPAFAIPALRQMGSARALHHTHNLRSPNSQRYARPLPYRLGYPVATIGRAQYATPAGHKASKYPTVSDLITALQRQGASPITHVSAKRQRENKELALIAAIGKYGGAQLFRSMSLITGGEADIDLQRRLSAAALGYLATCFSPQQSEFEAVLVDASLLYKNLLTQAA